MKRIIVLLVVAGISGAGGFLVPRMMMSGGEAPAAKEGEAEHGAESSEHGAGKGKGDGHGKKEAKKGEHGAEGGHEGAASAEEAFVPFGEVVVNLNEERLTRYLRLNMTFLVAAEDEAETKKLIETRKAVLKNWVLGYLADRKLDEVLGSACYNRLRREIQDQFNSMLFDDGVARIQEVLFEEFGVQ